MSWDGKERREYRRYGVRRLGIQYGRPGLLGALTGLSTKYLVLNVSLGGLYFMAQTPLATGKQLRMKLDIREGDTASARGRVVWTEKSAEHDAYKIGVQFTGMSRRTRAWLEERLDGSVLDRIEVTTGIYLREVERL